MSAFKTAATGLFLALLSLATATPIHAATRYEPDPNADRSAVPDAYKWKPEHLYATPADWEKDLKALQEELPKLKESCEGKLGSSAQVLYDCLQRRDADLLRFYRLYAWANYNFDIDQKVDETKARFGQVKALEPVLGTATAYFNPEIIALDDEKLASFFAENEKLKLYDWHIKDVRRMKPYTLSPKEERIMALMANVASIPGDTHEALLEVDAKYGTLTDDDGKQVELTQTGFTRYRATGSLRVRTQARDLFFGTLRSYQNTLAMTLNGVARNHIMNKEARGYKSCLEAALTPDNLSPTSYKMLIDTVRSGLPRTLHKYISLRKKVLKLDGKVTFPNLYNPMIDVPEPSYTYEEARNLVLQALKPLGKDYVDILAQGTDPANGWIDVYPNTNKRSGAYSSGFVWDSHPYVLHNFDNTLDATFTLAHEFGHALHSYYSNKNQPFIYAGYTTFLAEVASTTNEMLLLDHLLKTTKDPKIKLLLLNQRLETMRLTIFRQTLFAEFELRFHEHAEKGEALTPAFLNDLYKELITTYYGPDYEMGPDDSMEWGFIPHFYYNFYVFTYATGLTSGISLARQIEKDPKAAERYKKELLSAGSSAPPLEILKRAGVDLETPKPIEDVLALFEQTVDEFDALWTRTYGTEQKKK